MDSADVRPLGFLVPLQPREGSYGGQYSTLSQKSFGSQGKKEVFKELFIEV